MKLIYRVLRPRLRGACRRQLTWRDKLTLGLGTGLGIGFLKPAPATWGSLLGMGYLAGWWWLPGGLLRVAVGFSAVLLAFPIAGRCAVLLGQKDPRPVVIDEIVALPFTFWPLLYGQESHWWVWGAVFVLYRMADILKPWPARAAERLPGGIGIVMDDVVSAIYAGGVVAAFMLVKRGGV